MRLNTYAALAGLLSLALPAFAQTAPTPAPFTGPDFSGVYDCTGQDHHEGAYTGTVTMERVPAQSSGAYGAYTFRLDVPGYGSYVGQAAAHGMHVGIHFALTDPSTRDYGTGIARFRKAGNGKWRFHKFYYEPEFKNGNFGTENCLQR